MSDFFRSVIQAVKPWVSSEDIEKGTQWADTIGRALEQASYGVVCLTGANVQKPWINFEAGALAKQLERSRVSPFLFRLAPHEVTGPLTQFQSTTYERNDVRKLVGSINSALDDPLQVRDLDTYFDRDWPSFKAALDAIPEDPETAPPRRDAADMLAELVQRVRELQRISEEELIAETGRRSDLILSILRDSPDLKVSEIAELSGFKPPYLYRLLPAMEADGMVSREGAGWRPTVRQLGE